jgi:hypothetical protein
MALVSFALRLIASRILKDHTLAGDGIHDSPVDPLAPWTNEEVDTPSKPIIAIYTTDNSSEGVGRSTTGGTQKITLAFNMFLPPDKVAIPDGEGGVSIEVTTQNTGAATALDIVQRQVLSRFQTGDDAWQEVWRKFVLSVENVITKAQVYQLGTDLEIPAIAMTVEFSAIPEPDFAGTVTAGWQALFALMENEPEYQQLTPFIRGLIEGPAGLTDWQKLRYALGWSADEADAAGVANL